MNQFLMKRIKCFPPPLLGSSFLRATWCWLTSRWLHFSSSCAFSSSACLGFHSAAATSLSSLSSLLLLLLVIMTMTVMTSERSLVTGPPTKTLSFTGGCHDTGSNVFEREQLESAQPEIPPAVFFIRLPGKDHRYMAVQHPMTQVSSMSAGR